jgi:hypothetical protein
MSPFACVWIVSKVLLASARNASPPKPSLADRATKVFGLPLMEDPAKVASTGPDPNVRIEQRKSEEEIQHQSEFTAPGDVALFREVQDSIRRMENEHPDYPGDRDDTEEPEQK